MARTEGGAGLIITGACAIAFPHGVASMKEPGLSDDKYIPGLKVLADAIHAANGYILSVFLTRRDNKRSDDYGGPLAGRAPAGGDGVKTSGPDVCLNGPL
ncbi:hypothetical protein KKR91_03685 [Arthrobacter jiangjiafuii]|uniref:NADH:flavin oxidoreductase / NADH oxidase family protein n=1 Tax=Arthrobacter jiangjiafuii TaxID=2817475 RepID=A0A975M685_9MICC|nr:hypothetical protein [Arthrobacter jiangjiafuii]QWC10738.1 hypothetical protein KKR91_03685 [Arthrobacter jiangjiafuii]